MFLDLNTPEIPTDTGDWTETTSATVQPFSSETIQEGSDAKGKTGKLHFL